MGKTLQILLITLFVTITACGGRETHIDSPANDSIVQPMPSYVYFEAIDSVSSLGIRHIGGSSPFLEYSKDGRRWARLTSHSDVDFGAGEHIMLRGNNPEGLSSSIYRYSYLALKGRIKIYGDLMGLIDYTRKVDTIPCDFCFVGLFYGNSSIIEVSDSLLSAKGLSEGCYFGMFGNCCNLQKAPSLYAKDLRRGCYSCMFKNCEKLSAIKVGFSQWDTTNNVTDLWCRNVASEGIFSCPKILAPKIGESYIPHGWKIKNYE